MDSFEMAKAAGCFGVSDELAALREENARLTRELAGRVDDNKWAGEEMGRLARERDEARAEREALLNSLSLMTESRDTAEAEVARWKVRMDEECCRLEAEVSRLEGLILDWELYEPYPRGWNDALAEVRRVVEEVRQKWAGSDLWSAEVLSRLDPLRVEDLLDGLPRLSTESEALRVMGDGQRLTRMREIK